MHFVENFVRSMLASKEPAVLLDSKLWSRFRVYGSASQNFNFASKFSQNVVISPRLWIYG